MIIELLWMFLEIEGPCPRCPKRALLFWVCTKAPDFRKLAFVQRTSLFLLPRSLTHGRARAA